MPDIQKPLGGQFSPSDIARRRRLAEAYSRSSISATPSNLGEGLAVVGKALAARGISRGLDEQEASGRESADAVFRAMLEGERTEGPGGIDGRIFSAAQNPFLSDSQRSIVSAMMQRDFGQQDRTAQNTEFERRLGLTQGFKAEQSELNRNSRSEALTAQNTEFDRRFATQQAGRLELQGEIGRAHV